MGLEKRFCDEKEHEFRRLSDESVLRITNEIGADEIDRILRKEYYQNIVGFLGRAFDTTIGYFFKRSYR